MKILAVDTTLAACSVAVISHGHVLAHVFERMERGHAEALAPMVEKAMASAQISFSALDRLGVTIGPGTFTGQRVGLAFMRGLRVALKIPLVGVTSLATMAHQAMMETGLSRAAAVHDARRGDVYLELCASEPSDSVAMVLPLAAAADRIAEFARASSTALAGTAQEAIGKLVAAPCIVGTNISVPDALWAARLSSRLPPSARAPSPLYLRPPDAKLSATR